MPVNAISAAKGAKDCAEKGRPRCSLHGSTVYRRHRLRRPERTFLCRMVQNHLTIWLAMHDDGTRCGISSVTEMEFRWYLQCGNLAHGFCCRLPESAQIWRR